MNILPKKRWHVRTKDNIARVRKDEAKANEEERVRLEKLQYAESEARIKFLRNKSKSSTTEPESVEPTTNPSQHVELFSDYQSHVKTTNKDLEKEKKEEKEKYEKQIGYLTYLGQDTNEALKVKSWYEEPPKRPSVGDSNITEKDIKNKYTNDPLTLINVLLPPEKITQLSTSSKKPKLSDPLVSPKLIQTSLTDDTFKHKKKRKKEKTHKNNKHKKSKKRKKEKKLHEERKLVELQQKKLMLDQLRKERMRREEKERARQNALTAPKDVTSKENISKNPKATPTPRIVQKYNSQFNPELAKQNMI